MNTQSQWLFEAPPAPRVSIQEEIVWEKANSAGQVGEKSESGSPVFILWNFAVGSAALKKIHRSFLDDLAADLKSIGALSISVVIEGHSSNTDIAARNQQVSKLRAEAVRIYLVQRGVPPRLISGVDAFGSSKPWVPNTTPENMAKNRRVEIHIATVV
jgi:outer membrane protein OmpA-like peptidoglycan-associated protein